MINSCLRVTMIAVLLFFAIGMRAASAQYVDISDARSLSVSGSHACAVDGSGAVWCWGANFAGQLGDGTLQGSLTAIAVPGLRSDAIAVAVGSSHSCALLDDGSVHCWGGNDDGQLGDGSGSTRLTPTAVAELGGVAIAIAAASAHSCAVLDGGAVRCWGDNRDGKLGNGGTDDSLLPAAVVGLPAAATALALGSGFSCALLDGGAVHCWGNNWQRQLGHAEADTAPGVPVELPAPARLIAAGHAHACAAIGTSAVYCWGSNVEGELGDGGTAWSSAPLATLGLTGTINALAAGVGNSCAATSDGLRCWGSAANGQLGIDSARRRVTSATPVHGIGSDVLEVVSKEYASCSRHSDGRVRCWGGNRNGVLGDGTQSAWRLPTAVVRDAALLDIAAAAGSSCAVDAGGAVRCWGQNGSGQLGDGALRRATAPIAVAGLGTGMLDVAIGFDHACAVSVQGAVYCWGGDFGLQPIQVNGLPAAVVAVEAGVAFSCALDVDGAVWCWGDNWQGQLGNGGTTSSSTPVAVSGLSSGVRDIAVGANHACAVAADRGVLCWGANGDGQLGNGSNDASGVPLAVSDLSGARSVHVGDRVSCAILDDGSARCWGHNSFGQLGNAQRENSNVPVQVSGIDSALADIAPGAFHTCAADVDGKAWCWGLNGAGVLGAGRSVSRLSPAVVDGPSGVVAMSAANEFSCALLDSGDAQCWGSDQHGELGDGGRDFGLPDTVKTIDPRYIFTDGFERSR